MKYRVWLTIGLAIILFVGSPVVASSQAVSPEGERNSSTETGITEPGAFRAATGVLLPLDHAILGLLFANLGEHATAREIANGLAFRFQNANGQDAVRILATVACIYHVVGDQRSLETLLNERVEWRPPATEE